jgi:HK97 family phage portal protein
MGWWSNLTKMPEERALGVTTPVSSALFPATGAPLDVNTANALRVSDAYACVRVLADSVASLPLHAYRRTDQGRIPAGPDQRIVQLLNRPSPGSTSADLLSQVMVHLNVHGDAFIGKYRSDNEIVQLGLLDPTRVNVELKGQRVVYTIDTDARRQEYGVSDICHIKAMSADGLKGMSPVEQCRTALGLSGSLQRSAKAFTEQGSRPSGVLSVENASHAAIDHLHESWRARHSGAQNMHKVAVMDGQVTFTPLSFTNDDAQFLQQRELSAREVARIFRVPAWAIDAPTGDSMTYSNVAQQNRALVDYSLRPWLVRIERAISNDVDLCPGGTYVEFLLDALLRGDTDVRSQVYERALNPQTGWMTRAEVRALENLNPEQEATDGQRSGAGSGGGTDAPSRPGATND